jgi:outer membrane protein
MKQRILFLGSTGRWPGVWGSLPRKAYVTSDVYVARHVASGRIQPPDSLRSPERTKCCLEVLAQKIFAAILTLCLAHPVSALTLENVLQTTLEKNPAIQEAKAGLEQAVGQRLVFRSGVWPHVELGVPAGMQFGHRAGESGVKGFGVGRGAVDQTLFNVAVPHSLQRGDVEVLIAQQQLNVAVVEQLHAARLAFYAALYNQSLESIRREQQQRLQENVATQKNRFEAGLADRSAFTSATIPAAELETKIESAHRERLDAQLHLAQAMAIDPTKGPLPEPQGELQFVPMHVNLNSETAAALRRRTDVKLARLFVRAANEDERIIAADYYPVVTGGLRGEYVPVTGIHRQGSTSRTQDFIGSEIRERAAYTWQVVDNGKVGGAVLRARSAREINELTCRKLEADIPRELSRIAASLKATEEREQSLASATAAAEESARAIQQNVASGLVPSLEYRITQNGFLETKSGLLNATYQHNVAVAEWDRATGRYFQFSSDTAKSP